MFKIYIELIWSTHVHKISWTIVGALAKGAMMDRCWVPILGLSNKVGYMVFAEK